MPRCYLVKKAATKHPAGPASSGRWPYREPLSPTEAETAPSPPAQTYATDHEPGQDHHAADQQPAVVTSTAFGRVSPMGEPSRSFRVLSAQSRRTKSSRRVTAPLFRVTPERGTRRAIQGSLSPHVTSHRSGIRAAKV